MNEQNFEQEKCQPESHIAQRSSLLWIVTSFVLLIIIGLVSVMGYFYWPSQVDQVVCEECCSAPFFYTSFSDVGHELIMVDRCSQEEEVLYSAVDVGIMIVAVPELNYDERIFVSFVTEADGIGGLVYELNVETGISEIADFSDYLPSNSDARVVSKDQTKMAVVYDNPNLGDDLRAIAVIDLLTGEREILGELGDGEYYAGYQGDNTFSGSAGFRISWLSDTCISALIYGEPSENLQTDNEDQKSFIEQRIYCIE